MTERDQEIIQLVGRYRIGTNATFQKLAFQNQSLNAVSKVTARLCRERMLQRYPLIPPQDYFTLGPRSIQLLGYGLRRSEPLGPQALPMDYAVLLYCANGDRIRLTKSELCETAAWLPNNLSHVPYCRTSKGILELVRVDLGGSPRHVAKKLATDCALRMEIPEFQELIELKRFQIVLLTTTNTKARLIRQAIQSLTWKSEVRLHLAMIQKLTQLQLRNA